MVSLLDFWSRFWRKAQCDDVTWRIIFQIMKKIYDNLWILQVAAFVICGVWLCVKFSITKLQNPARTGKHNISRLKPVILKPDSVNVEWASPEWIKLWICSTTSSQDSPMACLKFAAAMSQYEWSPWLRCNHSDITGRRSWLTEKMAKPGPTKHNFYFNGLVSLNFMALREKEKIMIRTLHWTNAALQRQKA